MKKLICCMMMLMSLLIFSGAAIAAEYVYSASVEGELSLYISPDDESYIITKIPACSRLKLLETERTWGLVEFNNKAGWINLSFTRTTYSKAAEATGNDSAKSVQVNSKEGNAVLYNVPSDDFRLGSSEKYRIPNSTVLKITRQTASGWGLVSMHGKYAWIKMDETQAYQTQTDADKYGIYYVYVLSDEGKGLELWESERAKNLCAVIPDCIKLTVRETKGNYAYVSYDGINGWINLDYTTQSLANAQSNAGTQVNAEYTVEPKTAEETVDMLSVPSDNPNDGGNIVATLKKGEAVFVLRSTLSGWSLINYDGNLGWIPPESLTLSETIYHEDVTDIYTSPEKGFVATLEGKGLELYSTAQGKLPVAVIPETTEIKVIAEKSGYKYIYCDYAAGWTEDVPVTATYEEALKKYPGEKKEFYVTERETDFMSLPTGNELCGSVVLSVIPEGKYFEVIKTVTTGKTKWLLAQLDGQLGWIRMNHADKAEISIIFVLLIIFAAALLVAIAALLVHIIKKRNKSLENAKKEIDKNEKSIQNESSGTGEESSNVPCER